MGTRLNCGAGSREKRGGKTIESGNATEAEVQGIGNREELNSPIKQTQRVNTYFLKQKPSTRNKICLFSLESRHANHGGRSMFEKKKRYCQCTEIFIDFFIC